MDKEKATPARSKGKRKCIKCKRPVYCSELCKEHFMNYFEKKVWRTIHKFNLFTKQDRLAVAVSGGKDSTVCLYVLKKLGHRVEGITVDAVIGNYTQKNLENLRRVCGKYDIKLNEISFREEFGLSLCYITNRAKAKGLNYSSCLICGVLRRYLLNKKARELEFDAIATGHNLDDEAQAFVMNVFRNDLTLAMRQGPITGSGTKKTKEVFVKRVKPLYMCTEKETTAYSKLMKFPVNYEKCPCSINAYRREYRSMLDEFEKRHPPIKYNIVNFFLRTMYGMKEREDTELLKQVDKASANSQEINACIYCGEPSAKESCKRCQILLALKDEKGVEDSPRR
jgi:tRNA-5-methyluridine54 2-sulfurtransferase